LFVAIGSAELSSKMASYALDQKVFVTKTSVLLVVLVLLGRDGTSDQLLCGQG
jgi:hypothetical protein